MLMVPGAGLEPARPLSREILSLLCLPIPPPGLGFTVDYQDLKHLFKTPRGDKKGDSHEFT